MMTDTRRGKYSDWITKEGLLLVEGWARDGLTDEQIAHNIGIARSTLYGWKNSYPEFDEALRKGKEVIDREVENALLNRALGYSYVEEQETEEVDPDGEVTTKKTTRTKHVVADTTAQIFWLKNRKSKEWRDRKEMEISGGLDIEERAKVFGKYLESDE